MKDVMNIELAMDMLIEKARHRMPRLGELCEPKDLLPCRQKGDGYEYGVYYKDKVDGQLKLVTVPLSMTDYIMYGALIPKHGLLLPFVRASEYVKENRMPLDGLKPVDLGGK